MHSHIDPVRSKLRCRTAVVQASLINAAFEDSGDYNKAQDYAHPDTHQVFPARLRVVASLTARKRLEGVVKES